MEGTNPDLVYPREQLTLYRNQIDRYEYDLDWSGNAVTCKMADNEVWEIWPGGPINNPQGWGEMVELSFDEVLSLTDRAGYIDPEGD
jgi:hypothetical protein